MEELRDAETITLYQRYEATPQVAGRTLTIAQCDELQAMGIPWPISGDLSRTQPVRHRTRFLRQHDEDEGEDAA